MGLDFIVAPFSIMDQVADLVFAFLAGYALGQYTLPQGSVPPPDHLPCNASHELCLHGTPH